MNGGDISEILVAAAAVIGASGTFYSTVKNSRQIEKVHGIAAEMAPKVTQIDAAVNGKPPGETTMVSQVQDLHDQIPAPVPPVEDQDAVLPLLKKVLAELEEIRADAPHSPQP